MWALFSIALKSFLMYHIPLRVNCRLIIFPQTVNGTGTVGGEFTLVSGSNVSTPLAFNASAAEVAEAVNDMKDWEGLVLVDRQELWLSEPSDSDDGHEGDMFEWRLTFSSVEGDVDELRVRSTILVTH